MLAAKTAPERSLLGAVGGAMLLHGVLTGCSAEVPQLATDPAATFVCDNGITFRVDFYDGWVRVTTSTSSYDLAFQASSIGRTYSSDHITFIQDEERGVLIGAGGGPFKRCHEA